MATKKYNVLTAVDYNNERFEAGSSIELEDKHAKPLIEVKAIEIAQDDTGKETKKK